MLRCTYILTPPPLTKQNCAKWDKKGRTKGEEFKHESGKTTLGIQCPFCPSELLIELSLSFVRKRERMRRGEGRGEMLGRGEIMKLFA